MLKEYKVAKSKYFSEGNESLFCSYVFEYFSTHSNKWCILKNVDMKEYLKDVFIYQSMVFNSKKYFVDFDIILNRNKGDIK